MLQNERPKDGGSRIASEQKWFSPIVMQEVAKVE